jgi:predicted PolB exonuclease-like 3'-5' exonuclease
MMKSIHNEVWAFDVEWVPDPASGRRTYNLPATATDDEVLQHMWKEGGASETEPRPYLKTVLCRVVSIAAVVRRKRPDGSLDLQLRSLPSSEFPEQSEAAILHRFLDRLGQSRPQLVGFNSHSADLPILVQRALAHELTLPAFCARPEKPWLGPDYFARENEYHVDLKNVCGSWGNAAPTLHQLATACRIPGKIGTDGLDVVELWRNNQTRRIVQYNECDALTTYLLWLRAAHLAGHVSRAQFDSEQRQLEQLLEERCADTAQQAEDNAHLIQYLTAWRAFRAE